MAFGALLFLTAALPTYAQQGKIGYVNFIEAMRSHPDLANKRKKFQEMFGKREQELKKILDKIKGLEKELGDEAKRLVMSEADRRQEVGRITPAQTAGAIGTR